MIHEPIEEAYFNWLCTKVCKAEVPTPSLTYFHLLRALHGTEFVWLLSGDDNRAEDGVELRTEFLRVAFTHNDPEWMSMPCSVLEMLIALANRAAFETDRSTVYWFWTFIENLGMREFNDASNFDPREVSDILYRLVWRTYDYEGHGGMFPLTEATHDQRKQEIWYQFCEYLLDQERL